VDVFHALTARYCVRQDARGFIALWAVVVALAAAAAGTRRVSRFAAVALASLIVLSVGFASIVFRWCYESAAPSLGLVVGTPGKGLDAIVCLSPHAVEMIYGWIAIVVSCVAAIGLVLFGISQRKSALRRGLSFGGAVAALLFAAANFAFMLFGIAWCQSQRLF